MLDSGVILMRGQERGMGGADGWMVVGGGGAKKGVHRPSSIDPMRHCNPDEKSPPQGGREREGDGLARAMREWGGRPP